MLYNYSLDDGRKIRLNIKHSKNFAKNKQQKEENFCLTGSLNFKIDLDKLINLVDKCTKIYLRIVFIKLKWFTL